MIDEIRAGWDGREVTGPDARVALIVDNVAGSGKVTLGLVIESGRLTVHDEGPSDTQLTVLLPESHARSWAAGELDLAVAYMRGDAKITGDPGPVIGVVKSLSPAGEGP